MCYHMQYLIYKLQNKIIKIKTILDKQIKMLFWFCNLTNILCWGKIKTLNFTFVFISFLLFSNSVKKEKNNQNKKKQELDRSPALLPLLPSLPLLLGPAGAAHQPSIILGFFSVREHAAPRLPSPACRPPCHATSPLCPGYKASHRVPHSPIKP